MISTPLHIILCLVPRNVDIPSALFVLYIGYHVSLACWNDEFSSSLLPLRARLCRRPLSLPEVSAEHRSAVVRIPPRHKFKYRSRSRSFPDPTPLSFPTHLTNASWGVKYFRGSCRGSPCRIVTQRGATNSRLQEYHHPTSSTPLAWFELQPG